MYAPCEALRVVEDLFGAEAEDFFDRVVDVQHLRGFDVEEVEDLGRSPRDPIEHLPVFLLGGRLSAVLGHIPHEAEHARDLAVFVRDEVADVFHGDRFAALGVAGVFDVELVARGHCALQLLGESSAIGPRYVGQQVRGVGPAAADGESEIVALAADRDRALLDVPLVSELSGYAEHGFVVRMELVLCDRRGVDGEDGPTSRLLEIDARFGLADQQGGVGQCALDQLEQQRVGLSFRGAFDREAQSPVREFFEAALEVR